MVALMAHAGQGDYRRCLDAGTDESVSKPFSIYLPRLSRFWLRRSRTSRSRPNFLMR